MTTHFNIYLSIFLTPLQEAFSSSQHSNSADRAVLLSLATEKGDIGSIMHTVKSNIKALEGMIRYFFMDKLFFILPSATLYSSSSLPFYSLLYFFLYFFPPTLHFIHGLSMQSWIRML